jgi:hypothetical protein
MTTTLDLGWTDFPIRGVFVPFLYQCVDYLAKAISGRSGGRQYYHLVGEAARLPGGQRMDIETPSGQRRSLVYEPQETPIFTETDEPGFYRVVSEGGDTRFAVNLDTQESDFTPLDVELFVAAMINPVTDSQEMMEMRQETSRLQNSEVERRQRLWWYLAFVLLALVIMETLLASRTHR